jgi:hypothetical protein
MPDDLPGILYYRVGCTVRATLPRRPVSYVGSSGATDAAQVCPNIPHGADAWREEPAGAWRPLKELPPAWLPWLNRDGRQ